MSTNQYFKDVICSSNVCPCKEIKLSCTIWTAAEQGNIDALQSRLRAKPSLLNLTDKYGYTALHYAAQNDHTSIVQLLLGMKADPNASICGATPLHRAAFAGSLESCRSLLQHKADVNAQDYSFGDCNTPFHKCIEVSVDWDDIGRELLGRVLDRLGCPPLSTAERAVSQLSESSSNQCSSSIVVVPTTTIITTTTTTTTIGGIVVANSTEDDEKESLFGGSRCMWCQEIKVAFKRVAQGKQIVCSTCYDKKMMFLI
eukprot:gene24562-31984_t